MDKKPACAKGRVLYFVKNNKSAHLILEMVYKGRGGILANMLL